MIRFILVLFIVLSTSHCRLAAENSFDRFISEGSQLAFIDDIVDDVVDDVVDKNTPFKFRIGDTVNKVVSKEPRRLRFVLEYKKKFTNRFANLDENSFGQAINDNLIIDFDDIGWDYNDFYPEDIYFELEDNKVKSNNSDFREAHFLSDELLVIEKAQSIEFEFNIINFMSDLGISETSFSKTPEFLLKIKPLQLELLSSSFRPADSLISAQASDIISPQFMDLEIQSEEELDLDIYDLAFNFKFKNKDQSPLIIKKTPKGKKHKLDLAFLGDNDDRNLRVIEGSGVSKLYSISLPLGFQLRRSDREKFFNSGDSTKVKVPVRFKGLTESGLDFTLKGITISKLRAL